MLRVRNSQGFNPASSVGFEYIKENELFSVYIDEYLICKISSEGDGFYNVKVTIEIFDTKLYSNNVEKINQIIDLYQEM